MVAISPKRQKYTHKVISDHCAKHPPSYYFSALTYKQAPETLAISSQSLLLNVPIAPIFTHINTIAGDLFSLSSPIHKIPVKIIEEYHSPYPIHHLQWDQKGNSIASIDEKGQLAVWTINTLHDWSLLYQLDLKQPIAAFYWLNTDRIYTVQNTTIKKESIQGCRNPYGQLGFITVTVHGEISVHYQHIGSIFSSFSTTLPRTGRREINRADAGCFGMSLAGIDDWQRISHAAVTLHEGQLYLATHYASSQPKSISVYQINIRFLSKEAIYCKPIVNMKISKDIIMGDVTHILFRKGLSPLELVIVFGEHKDTYSSYIGTWALRQSEQTISSVFGTMTHDKSILAFQSGLKCDHGFISSILSTDKGQLIVGLSDGSIYLQGMDKEYDIGHSMDDHYYSIVKNNKELVSDMVLSPNETHLIYVYSSGKIGISRLDDDRQVDRWTDRLIECLCNNRDYLDILSEIVRIDRYEDIEDMIQTVLSTYESFCHNSTNEEWSLSLLERGYGFMMALYERLPNKKIQSMNLSRASQLPLILECFISSCMSDYDDIHSLLQKDIDTTPVEFDTNSLWSLVSLSKWTLDYLKWILHEWNMLIHCKRPLKTKQSDIHHQVVHAVLLLHKDSRVSLCNILKMIHYFIRYATTSNYQLESIPESQPLLLRYTSSLLDDEPVTLKEAIEFLSALDSIHPVHNQVNRWSLFMNSTLADYDINKIKTITDQYKDMCTQPAIYLHSTLYTYDVIQKSPIMNTSITCIRCHQHTQPTHSTHSTQTQSTQDKINPISYAPWYQSLSGHCVCGGLFH